MQLGTKIALMTVAATALVGPDASGAPAAVPPREASARPVPARDAALEMELAIDVRSAPLADVVEEMAAASGVRMRLGRSAAPVTSSGAGDQRITLHADRASVEAFQRAIATLLQLRWTRGEIESGAGGVRPPAGREPEKAAGAAVRYTLEEDPQARERAAALRQRQANRFLEGLRETAEAMTTPATAAAYTEQLRAEFRREHPEFSARTLEDLDVDFLRQALLTAPLDLAWRSRLAQSRWVSIPLARLNDQQARIMAAFALGEPASRPGGSRQAALLRSAENLTRPDARVQYRLFYGDRWTDTVLRVQVGVPGDWARATLPSILYREEDGSALYPQSRKRPQDASVWRRLPPTFSVAGKSWDEALVDLARTMKIRVASDSYLRPQLFEPRAQPVSLAGLPLTEALDRLSQAHGMFWWKEGDWYYFRSRTWVEEENVAVPDRFLRRWTESARQNGRLSAADLDLLGTLGEEQLMTLNLLGPEMPPAGSPLSALDADGAWLASAGLMLYRTLSPAQRELALNGGLPALWLAPIQQQIFSAIAAELGFYPQPETLSEWGFVIDQRFDPPSNKREPVSGVVSLQWRFGPVQSRAAQVTISDARLPREQPAARE